MLYFVGLGLGDAKDITVKGLEIVKRCQKVNRVKASLQNRKKAEKKQLDLSSRTPSLV